MRGRIGNRVGSGQVFPAFQYGGAPGASGLWSLTDGHTRTYPYSFYITRDIIDRSGGYRGRKPNVFAPTPSGVWTLSEIYSAYRGFYGTYRFGNNVNWPGGTISIDWGYYGTENWIDVTLTGSGTFAPIITSTYPAVTYDWEVKRNSASSWVQIPGEHGPSLDVSGMESSDDGMLFRVVVNAGLKSVRSAPARLQFDVLSVSFLYGPGNVQTTSYAYLYAYAGVNSLRYTNVYRSPSYQWQVSTNKGVSWSSVPGATSSTLGLSVTPQMSGNLYRCRASYGIASATSSVATIIYG